jgi:diaminopimelate decarboxylase
LHHFDYRNGALYAEDVPVEEIAPEVGTPFYCLFDSDADPAL